MPKDNPQDRNPGYGTNKARNGKRLGRRRVTRTTMRTNTRRLWRLERRGGGSLPIVGRIVGQRRSRRGGRCSLDNRDRHLCTANGADRLLAFLTFINLKAMTTRGTKKLDRRHLRPLYGNNRMKNRHNSTMRCHRRQCRQPNRCFRTVVRTRSRWSLTL